MGDKIIITEEDEAPKPPDVVVVKQEAPKTEKVVTEKTIIKEVRKEDD
jgi:hypothetical protein